MAVAVSGAYGYSTPTRASLRSLGHKSVAASSACREVGSSLKMEGKFLTLVASSRDDIPFYHMVQLVRRVCRFCDSMLFLSF